MLVSLSRAKIMPDDLFHYPALLEGNTPLATLPGVELGNDLYFFDLSSFR